MIDVVLYEPEIPQNTGNIIRLCANTGAQLHLIHPLGFTLDDSKLLRAGLDYHEWTRVREYQSFERLLDTLKPAQLFAISTRGKRSYADAKYPDNVALLFGAESRGLPTRVLEMMPSSDVLRLPMITDRRSLNLSNAVSIVVYEAWKQNDFQSDLSL